MRTIQQRSSALYNMPEMVLKQRLPITCGCVSTSCPPVKLGGLGSCATPSGGKHTIAGTAQKERHELLWQDFFVDPRQWSDVRQDKASSRHPDFRHRRSKKVLWLDSKYKPSWVDSQLALWEDQLAGGSRGFPGSASTSTSENETSSCSMEKLVKGRGKWRRLCEEGQLPKAIEALDLMLREESDVDTSLLYIFLKRCIAKKDLALGRRIHALTLKTGYASNPFLANHFIRMYAAHGRLVEATQAFTKVASPDTYMWASIIAAHSEHGEFTQALKLYREMRESTLEPNNYVFVAILKACATATSLPSGKEVHADFLVSKVDPDDVFVGNCLVSMYAKCGSLGDAREVFDRLPTRNVVTWNAMITGYAQHGLGEEALRLYARMQEEGIISADVVTFTCLIKACGRVGALHEGKLLHSQIQQRGLGTEVVIGTSLVDMYGKCGSLEDARAVFDSLGARDAVAWTAMIAGYAQHGLGQEALTLYAQMQQDGMSPADPAAFMCLLQACGTAGALHHGQQLHAQIQGRGLETDVAVGSSVVDMYAKCGRLDEARKVFDRLPDRNTVTWTALLNGYAQHSDSHMAMQCFQEMLQQGVKPDSTTYICLLVACCHGGKVHEGQMYMKMMVEEHGLSPTAHHYTCMVDLLARSGRLQEAENLLRTPVLEKEAAGWNSLLAACKSHGDVECGRRCFEHLITLDPESAAAYVLLGNIYANAGRWKDVDRIESLRKSAGAWKKAARACIEVQDKVHEFTVGEERGDVSSKLRSMGSRAKSEGGHVPHTELVLKAVTDGKKEDALCGHAEKLALAYGLLNTPDGTTLLVTKNLRMCNDCHSSTKVVSRLERREIVVRDAHRVHRFVDGHCTCGDRH